MEGSIRNGIYFLVDRCLVPQSGSLLVSGSKSPVILATAFQIVHLTILDLDLVNPPCCWSPELFALRPCLGISSQQIKPNLFTSVGSLPLCWLNDTSW